MDTSTLQLSDNIIIFFDFFYSCLKKDNDLFYHVYIDNPSICGFALLLVLCCHGFNNSFIKKNNGTTLELISKQYILINGQIEIMI